MSEHKFTKGPWVIVPDQDSNCVIDKEDAFSIENTNEEWSVCAVWSDCGSGGESKYNANLIAAAPDLLKELESHCKVCQERNNWKNGCAGCFTERAIKKALGE